MCLDRTERLSIEHDYLQAGAPDVTGLDAPDVQSLYCGHLIPTASAAKEAAGIGALRLDRNDDVQITQSMRVLGSLQKIATVRMYSSRKDGLRSIEYYTRSLKATNMSAVPCRRCEKP